MIIIQLIVKVKPRMREIAPPEHGDAAIRVFTVNPSSPTSSMRAVLLLYLGVAMEVWKFEDSGMTMEADKVWRLGQLSSLGSCFSWRWVNSEEKVVLLVRQLKRRKCLRNVPSRASRKWPSDCAWAELNAIDCAFMVIPSDLQVQCESWGEMGTGGANEWGLSGSVEETWEECLASVWTV